MYYCYIEDIRDILASGSVACSKIHAADRNIIFIFILVEAKRAQVRQHLEVIHLLAVMGPAGGLHHSFVRRRIVIISLTSLMSVSS